ncbi:MAG: hypothetical protein ACRDGI_05220, partial [Candidatus Limnocylindrales bacterium]
APPATSTTIVGSPAGLGPVGEVATGHGTVVDTFRGSLGTVRIVGLPGSSVSIEVLPADARGHAAIRVGLSAGSSKSRRPSPGQAQNLADLGVPPRVTAGGSAQAGAPPVPAGGVPWASTCISLNVLGGAVQGSGCNNVYKKHTSGGDWYLSNEYWASASLTAWQGPLGLHLQGVGFETTWHPGNTIYSVAPTTTQSFGACTPWTVTASGTNNGITIGGSITGQICPSTLGPWNLRLAGTYPNSGAMWTGNVQGVANYQGAEGVQLVHSPPGVEANWDDYYLIGYCNGICF